jgi:hypothetical protein
MGFKSLDNLIHKHLSNRPKETEASQISSKFMMSYNEVDDVFELSHHDAAH